MTPRRVALFVVHGIGTQRRNWADEFVARVRRELERLDPGLELHARVAWWAPITQRAEDRLARSLVPRLAWRWLRRLVIGYGGDVVAYQSPAQVWVRPSWTYQAVHEGLSRELQDILRGIVAQAGALPERPVPLVVVAHSLGSVIFSDFVYDLESGVAPPRGFPQHYRLALRALFTIGSPLALYALRYHALGLDKPITLEPDGLWVNVLYKADVIGYPLRRLSSAYAAAVAEDWVLAPRWWPWYWTPVAHLAYWGDRRFIRRVAVQLARAAEPSVV